MSVGGQGGYQSGKSSTTGALFPYLGQLAGTMVNNLRTLGQGQSTTAGTQAITAASQQNLATGIQQMKGAFAGSGMGQSSALMEGINQTIQQSQVALAPQIANYQMMATQNQLQALQDIISLGQGTSISHQSGWNLAMGASSSVFDNPAASG